MKWIQSKTEKINRKLERIKILEKREIIHKNKAIIKAEEFRRTGIINTYKDAQYHRNEELRNKNNIEKYKQEIKEITTNYKSA